jgi:uncharacterized protein YaaN involved in tellurite resistance
MEVPDEAAIKKQIEETATIDNDEFPIKKDIDEFANKEDILRPIESLGADSMNLSAAKNSFLQVTIENLAKDGDEGRIVANGLMDLQRELKGLDPSLIDFTRTGILGKLFDPVRAYFAKYEKADQVIADIIASLDKGRATLKNDNTILEIEQQALHELTRKLNKESGSVHGWMN